MSTIKDASEPLFQRYEHFMKVPYKSLLKSLPALQEEGMGK